MRPEDRRYTKEHEWLQEKNGEVTIGITDHAASELGDIVFLELPEEGAEFAPGDSMGTIETVKAVEEIYAPVGGVVSAVNESLGDKPEIVNESPYEEGWLVKIKPDGRESDDIMDAAGYTSMVDGG